MNPIARYLLVPAASLTLPLAAASPESVQAPERFEVPAIDGFLAAWFERVEHVGLSVAIVKDGRVVLEKGYGARSLEDRRPVDPRTLFAIGSVTKQFTCACILLLAEDGRLSVHDPVAKYYPDLTRARDITLLDLMNHVSGYPDFYPLDFVERPMQRPIDPDELLRRYAGGPLDFEPGTKWSYSNTGYILLGRVVEKVSGESFGAFLERRILRPLGMTNTLYEPDPANARIARGYTTFALSDPEPAAPEGRGWIGAAGGLYSTPGDLAKWDLALMSGQVLKPESFALMTTPRQLADGRTREYGCGWSVKTQDGFRILSHNGAVSGFNAWNAMVPATRSAVIMTCNLEGGMGSLPSQIFSLLLKEPTAIPQIRGLPAADTVKAVFADLQKGKVNRRQLSDEFNYYLNDEKLAGAARRLKRFGAPTKAEVASIHERGGMEVTTTRLRFKSGSLRVLMYRKPDGTIEQFFIYRD